MALKKLQIQIHNNTFTSFWINFGQNLKGGILSENFSKIFRPKWSFVRWIPGDGAEEEPVDLDARQVALQLVEGLILEAAEEVEVPVHIQIGTI
jgi:hypothetical protein